MAASTFGDNTQVRSIKVAGDNVTAYGQNYIINGGFDYWNYATSQTANGYGSDDRWGNKNVGTTKTHSLVNATDTERALFNSSKFSRTVVTSVVGVTNQCHKEQKIENVTKLAGKTVTISFWAKADTNKNIAIEFYQNFGTSGTPSSTVTGIGSQLVALTSTWNKYTRTVLIPAILGKTIGTDGVHTSYTAFRFWFDAEATYTGSTASLGQQSGTFDIAEVKLEEGSVATPWTPYEGEFGGEVQACQRYYEYIAAKNYAFTMNPANQMAINTMFKILKRASPTISISGASSVNTALPSVTNITPEGFDFISVSDAQAISSTRSFVTGLITVSAEL